MYLLKFTLIGFQNFIHSVINYHSCFESQISKDWAVWGKAVSLTESTSKGKFLF